MKQPRRCPVAAAALVLLFTGIASSQSEPLCQTKVCPETEACRVMETCYADESCDRIAICLPAGRSQYLSGGCRIDEPLLIMNPSGSYDLRSCYTDYNCPPGFYCSTELMDVRSRCCHADPEPGDKPGSCPELRSRDDEQYFCVDECRSDADCYYSSKCCQRTGVSCCLKKCNSPDSCSLMTCHGGWECEMDANKEARCVLSHLKEP